LVNLIICYEGTTNYQTQTSHILISVMGRSLSHMSSEAWQYLI
jgi:hypothetical protein